MDSLAREWRKCRIVLDVQKHRWINSILPRNMVTDDLKNIINNMFFELYGYLDNDEREKTAEMLQVIKSDIHELAGHLVLASHMSDMVPSVTMH
jgi:hypothetical protein